MATETQIKSLEAHLKMKVNYFKMYSDGFSFTTPNELDAYKAAYKYQHSRKVVVSHSAGVNEWLVQVYN